MQILTANFGLCLASWLFSRLAYLEVVVVVHRQRHHHFFREILGLYSRVLRARTRDQRQKLPKDLVSDGRERRTNRDMVRASERGQGIRPPYFVAYCLSLAVVVTAAHFLASCLAHRSCLSTASTKLGFQKRRTGHNTKSLVVS